MSCGFMFEGFGTFRMRTDSCHTSKSKKISLKCFGKNWERSSSRNFWRAACKSVSHCGCKLSRLYETWWNPTTTGIAYTWLCCSKAHKPRLEARMLPMGGFCVDKGRWRDSVLAPVSRICKGPGTSQCHRSCFDHGTTHCNGTTHCYGTTHCSKCNGHDRTPSDSMIRVTFMFIFDNSI